jgi:acetyl-CoA acetyltransferase
MDLLAPFGMLMPASMFAPLVTRYMHEHRITEEQMAHVALTFRENAQRNPRAVTHGLPLTMTEYLSSRMVSSPLRLYDCCQESDGACAILVTTLERAQDLRCRPVRVLAAQQGGNPRWGSACMGTHTMPATEYGNGNGSQLADTLYAAAGVGPQDIQFAQIYDHFSGAVLMALENFGFCERGEAGSFVSSGAIRAGGRLPLNTAGGLLSEAYIHGLNLVVEAVRQLRGESTSQVTNAKVGLVTAGVGATPFSAAILAAS